MQKKALVTGAYGFVGRHVARALAADGYDVRAIGHGSWARGEWRQWGISEWYSASVDIESLTTYGGEPDVVFHCAGSGSVAFSMTHPYQDFGRTVGTTRDVVEYIRTVRPSAAMVMPSSAGVYGLVSSMPIRISDKLNPASPYGLHKKMAEDLCLSYSRHFGIRCAMVRMFSIYGITLRKQLLWDACSKMSSGDLTFAGTGNETRDWLHVEDAASLMLRAADFASPECPVVNGGTGTATSISAVVNAIAEDLGIGEKPRFSGKSRPGDPTDYQADIAEALAWGWKPERHWREEIRSYAHWFKEGAL